MIDRTAVADAEVRRARVDPRIPIDLVTGLSDSDPSALLRFLLRASSAAGNYAVILADRALWQEVQAHGTVISRNPTIARSECGATCCYGENDLVDSFYQLHLRRIGLLEPKLDYDRVLVEVAGDLGAGSATATVANDLRLDSAYRLARVLCAADTSACSPRPNPSRHHVIARADTVVLVGTSRCEAGELHVARQAIARLNPLAAVYHAEGYRAEASPAWRIAPGAISDRNTGLLVGDAGMIPLNDPGSSSEVYIGNLFNCPISNSSGDTAPCRAIRVRIPGEVDLMMVMEVVKDLIATFASDLLRLSAILNVRHADHPIALDIVDGVLVQPAYHDDDGLSESDICLLARGLDPRQTARAFERCVWQVAASRDRFEAAM